MTVGLNTTIVAGTFAQALLPTAVQTGGYTAVAKDFVLVDASAASRIVTLPTAPADQTRIGVKMVAVSGAFTTTVATGGADRFNLPTGPATRVITLSGESVILQYVASTATWTIQSGDTPLAALDLRFAPITPWLINISPFHTPATQTNWNTVTQSAGYLNGGYRVSSGAQNAEVGWDVVLGAGTWAIELIHTTTSNYGIISVQLDAVEVGTIDVYTAGSVQNVRTAVTGIVIASTGKKRLLLKMATKNASSSGYAVLINGAQLWRTA